VHQDAVTEIDLDARKVRFSELEEHDYDFLVLALGAEVNFFGVEGAEQVAFPALHPVGRGAAQEPRLNHLGGDRPTPCLPKTGR
jgi:NADPH-dependent 2,4-dienoyl-CoA reductase/sulfur reductase-like enzyme